MANKVDSELLVQVNDDRTKAMLVIPGDYPRGMMTLEFCLAVIQSESVKISDEGQNRLKQVLDDPPPMGSDITIDIAQAVMPRSGEDAKVIWSHELDDPDSQEDDETATAKNHYEQSAYVYVKKNQVIGVMTELTEGEDGCDVQGNAIAATPGKSLPFRLHPSIVKNNKDQLIAQNDGVLQVDYEVAKVNPLLDIANAVDFGTGNIDFNGNVIVRQEIKDRFVVKATGNVEIHGLIEDATIKCGGNLHAFRGMASRGNGGLQVDGNLEARHLVNVMGVVKGDADIASEIINSRMVVGGNLKIVNGALIGGVVSVTGSADIGVLGSEGGVPTQLMLGTVPLLAVELVGLIGESESLSEQIKIIIDKLAVIDEYEVQTPKHKEKIMELSFEQSNLQTTLDNNQEQQEGLYIAQKNTRKVNLRVNNTLHHSVLLTINGVTYKVFENVRGPVRIGWNEAREVVVKRANSEDHPIATIARRVEPAKVKQKD